MVFENGRHMGPVWVVKEKCRGPTTQLKTPTSTIFANYYKVECNNSRSI